MVGRTTDPVPIEMNTLASTRFDQIERDLKIWSAKPVAFAFDPAGTPLFSMMELAYSYAKRTADLGASIRSLVGADHIVPATIVARALIETVAVGCLFLDDMTRLTEAGDQDRLDERLSRYYVGAKDQTVKPVHVMDAMRHLERIDGEYVAYLDKKYGAFTQILERIRASGKVIQEPRDALSAMKNYDLLSEVSHPNGLGTQFLYPDSRNEGTEVDLARQRFRHLSLMAIWQAHHLLKALEASDNLPARFRAKFISTV